jgi:hypothetical protein
MRLPTEHDIFYIFGRGHSALRLALEQLSVLIEPDLLARIVFIGHEDLEEKSFLPVVRIARDRDVLGFFIEWKRSLAERENISLHAHELLGRHCMSRAHIEEVEIQRIRGLRGFCSSRTGPLGHFFSYHNEIVRNYTNKISRNGRKSISVPRYLQIFLQNIDRKYFLL